MYESQNAGADVARALGFNPKEIIEINLKFRAGDLLVVTTEQLVYRNQLKRVTDEIVKRKFFVSEIEDENPAPVAVPAEQRHDAATCCAERQEPDVASISANEPLSAGCDALRQDPDVGEGWRELGPEDVLQEGYECDVGVNSTRWVPTERAGQRVGDEDRYRRFSLRSENCDLSESQRVRDEETFRRRVTPVPEAPQARLAETRASRSAWDTPEEELAWFKKRVTWLDSVVERMKKSEAALEREIKIEGDQVTLLRSEVERLRLTPNELKQIHKALFVLDQLSATNEIDQEMWSTIRDMHFRLEGEK